MCHQPSCRRKTFTNYVVTARNSGTVQTWHGVFRYGEDKSVCCALCSEVSVKLLGYSSKVVVGVGEGPKTLPARSKQLNQSCSLRK